MLNIAIIGAGRMGHIHAHTLAARRDVRLVAIVDPRDEAAVELASRYGAKACDITSVLADPGIDAIVIASTADAHPGQIRAAAEAGKAIFCEKPLARDLEQVRLAVADVENAGIPFMLAFNRRFDPSFVALQAHIASGELGPVELLVLTSRDPAPPPLDYIKACGGIVRETSIHDIDMARWLTGEEPVSVYAQGASRSDPRIAEAGYLDTVIITMKMPSGALVTINNAWRATYGYDQRVEVHCAKGMAQLGNIPLNSLTVASGKGFVSAKPMTYFMERYAEAYRHEIDHFVTQVLAGEPMRASVRDGLRALEIAEAAMQSIQTGEPIRCEVTASNGERNLASLGT